MSTSGQFKRSSGRLRLRVTRSRESLALDGAQGRVRGVEEPVAAPPYLPWREFLPWFGTHWDQGDHITLVGKTKSGKTTAARHLILFRDHIVVFATKRRDPSLYEPLARAGFVMVDHFDADPEGPPRIIFRAPLNGPTKTDQAEQAADFQEGLVELFDTGGWCVYMDEGRYLSDNLRLGTEMETLWLQGRSLGLTLVIGTQRPVLLPREAFSEATWLMFWKMNDKQDIDRMAEFCGELAPMVKWAVPRLPKHEFLMVNATDGYAVRSRVDLKR